MFLCSGYYQIISKTCPCNVYSFKPHFYIEKLGYAGVYLFFLFLLQNIDCGYSIRVPTIYVLSKNKKNIQIFNFQSSKIHCILHGQVFVMSGAQSAISGTTTEESERISPFALDGITFQGMILFSVHPWH